MFSQHQRDLLEMMEELKKPPWNAEEDTYNVLLIGQIGVGKTSLFNTIASVLREEHIALGHTANDDRSVTTAVRHTLEALYKLFVTRCP